MRLFTFTTAIALATTLALILHSKLSALTIYLTTPAWHAKPLGWTLVRLAASAATAFFLARTIALLVVVAMPARRHRKRRSGASKAIVFVYSGVTLFVDPATAPAHVGSSRCAVCLGEDGCDVVLACKHVFHWDCVRPWLDAKNACPLCRAAQKRLGIDAEGRVVGGLH